MARSPRFDASDPLLDAPVAERLDLHGCRAADAAGLVAGCLGRWARRGPGTVVHIITGKGRGSAGRPVLRGLVARLLKGELRSLVAEWALDEDDGGYKVRLR
ncbi:MAG TPA: Smr/MutS family protein [Gemmatimonadales bacterium]|jgi:DNA-nicking Smr family endonuclease|nr:Smr/MutS family protein [Gemmatimonadales bacterium]